MTSEHGNPDLQTPPEPESFEAAFAALEKENPNPALQDPDVNLVDGGDAPNPNDPLAEVEITTLLSHPQLGPKLKSHIDTEHASQSQGMQRKWQEEYEQSRVPQITQQVTEQLLGTWFDGLEPDELGGYLAEHPNLAAAYASHKRTQDALKNPPPADPAGSPNVQVILSRIRVINQRLGAAGLPDEVRSKLDPSNYRDQGEAGLAKWESDVDDAIIAHKVKLQTAESLEAQRTALGAEDGQSALFSAGDPKGVLGDLENDPPQLLLERALAIEAAQRKR